MVRFKNRYVLVELIWKDERLDESLTEGAILAVLRESMATNFGDHGAGIASASLQVKYYNPLTSLCIVRCSRDQLKEVHLFGFSPDFATNSTPMSRGSKDLTGASLPGAGLRDHHHLHQAQDSAHPHAAQRRHAGLLPAGGSAA